MSLHRFSVRCATFLAVAGMLTSAASAVIIFNNSAAFNTAAGALGTLVVEGYETYPLGTAGGARTLNLNQFRLSYSMAGDPSTFGLFGISSFVDPTVGAGPTAGARYVTVTFPAPVADLTATLTFLFPAPIAAFGTDTKDVEAFTMSYSTSSGATGTAVPPAGNGVVQFFGIIPDTPITSISFSGARPPNDDGTGFDQTVFVSAVPELGSVALTALGIAAGCLWRMRQQRGKGFSA